MKNVDIYDFDKVLYAQKPCVVKFTSEGCYLCDGLTPIFDKIAKEYENQVLFFNLDVDDENNKK